MKLHLSRMNIVLLIIVGLLILWALGSWVFVAWVEEPAYTVVEKNDGYEIRQYPPHIVAETTLSGEGYDAASNSAFNILAGYIFGDNTTQEKIAMTRPVSATQSSEDDLGEKIAMTKPVTAVEGADGNYTIGFILPSEYSLEELPTPNDVRVKLREVPAKRVAARSFNGWYATDTRIEQTTKELLALLLRDNAKTLSAPTVARYNPPVSMPLVLRNEILVDVE